MIALKRPIVYLITPGEAASNNFIEQKKAILSTLKTAVRLGVQLVQIREKRLTSLQLFQLTSEACSIAKDSKTRILVNDRVDIAVAAGADGVHLTSRSFPIAAVREHFGKKLMIGASVHDLSSAKLAAETGADLAVFAPVFDTPGKGNAVGIEVLADICTALGGFPVIALGGISNKNWQSTILAGASGIAAIRAFNDEVSLSEIMSEIRKV